MKKLLFLVLAILAMSINLLTNDVSVQTDDYYQIYNSANGETLNNDELARLLTGYEVVFFGEFHDDKLIHRLELQLLENLYKRSAKLTISFEMFERDVQSYLKDYVTGVIEEKEFLENSRPWPNYASDYKPLAEFAKTHKLPVIAANVPRKYATLVSRMGPDELKSLPDNEKQFVAAKLNIFEDEYKREFVHTMKQNASHGMPVNPVMYENFYAAQCLKDDTMAESIFWGMLEHPRNLVIHFNGDFHSRKKLGTVQRLLLLKPDVGIAVITPVYIDEDMPFLWSDDFKQEGDFIILLRKM